MRPEFKINEAVTHANYPDLLIGQVVYVSPDNTSVRVRWNPMGVESVRTYMQGSKSLSHYIHTHSQPKLEAAMNLNAQQKSLLAALLKLRGNNREARTDVVARIMSPPMPNHVMSCVGLELRSLGLVSSENDGQQYNLWHLTTAGVNEALALLVEPAPAPESETWIVWSPGSKLPPVVMYPNRPKAVEVCEIMARKHPGQAFLPCQVFPGTKLSRKPVTTYTETLEIARC